MKRVVAKHPTVRVSLLLATILAIFAADLLTPLGTVIWALYTIPLLLSGRLPQRWFPLACATLCTMLIGLGFYFSEISEASMETVVFNRLAGVLVLWTMALILYQSRRLGSSLALRTEELKTKASLLNEANEAIIVRDMEDRILYWNRGAAERYGWFEKEAIGKVSHELLKTQFPEPLHHLMEHVLSNGTWQGELRHRTRDGKPVDVASRWNVQKDADGRVQAILEISTDVTELNQARELWREATVQMAAIFNSSPLPILVMDPGGHILRWNTSAERVFGWTEQEAVGKVCPTVPDSGLDDFKRMIEQAMQEGALHQLVRPRRTKRGTLIDASISISALPSHNGRPLGVVAILEDITERKRSEQELEASERRLRTILETEPECVKVMSEDGLLLYMNPAGLAMIEAESSGQVIGKPVYPLIAPPYREAFVAFNKRVFHGESGRMQFEIIGLQGRRLWMDTHAIPLRDEENATIGVLAITRDVTTRKQAEQQLNAQREILQKIFDHIPTMIALIDEDGRLQLANRAWERWRGWTVEEIHSQNINLLETGYPDPEYREKLLAFAKRADGNWMDIRTRVRDGRITDTSWAIIRLSDGMRIGIGYDITERKQAEAALEEARERFEDAFQHAAIGMALVSTDGRWLRVNKSLCSIVGYSEEELLATSFQAITHPDDLDADLAFVHQMLVGQIETYQMEKRYIHKRGHVVWILLNVTLVHDPDGAPQNFVAQIQDITERKQTDMIMAKMTEGVSAVTGQDFLHSLVTHLAESLSVDYVMIGRLSGEGGDKIRTTAVYAKGRIADNFEYLLAGTPCENVVRKQRCAYPSNVQREFPQDRLLADMGVEGYIGTPLHDSAGNALGLLAVLNGKPLDNPRQADTLLGIYAARASAEIERLQAEEALRKSERALWTSEQSLRALLRDREQLLRNLHDGLIQSLYAVGLSLEEVQRLIGEDIGKAESRLSLTVEDVNNLIRQVRQHLAVGDDALPFSANRLKNELRRVASSMERADSTKIDLKVDARAAACLTSEERREVLYIAQEAMSNCLRHSDASTMRVTLRMDRERVRLEVEDNGRGFDRQAVREHGNGLRNIEERADRIGAHVEFVSRPKRGTRVRLDVPIREESSLESRS